MFETLNLPVTPQTAAALVGVLLGLAFGALAQISRFCLRRGLVPGPDRAAALGTWAMALATATAGTLVARQMGLLDFSGHRYHGAEVSVLALTLGGLAFGVGMVLTRGCLSRLTVLSATGNLRAAFVIVLAAIAALATMRGVLAPAAAELTAITVALPALPWLSAALAIAAAALALRSGGRLVLGAAIGALVPLAWLTTGWLLLDDFDPLPLEALAFTGPLTESLFYVTAATALTPGFGLGLIGGVLTGAFAAAALRGELQWQSFHTPAETGRYALGALLMGVGGVLAGGCTVGAGLSGVASGSVAAVIALASIVAGAGLAQLRPLGRALPA